MNDSFRLPFLNEVVLHIIDVSTGRPIQTWKFKDQFQITIGRAADQDVEISDPYVSRSHASLVNTDGHWTLISLGRNGVVIDGKQVKEFVVQSEVTFRLGVEGPTLKFCEGTKTDDPGATYSFSVQEEPAFELDVLKVNREVQDIVEGDYFQDLQRLAKQMRSRKSNRQ